MAALSDKLDVQGRVCLFAKPPVAGRVKTRLAASIGKARARALAEAFLEDTFASLAALGWAEVVVATTDVDGQFPPPIDTAPRWPQGEGDLGARLQQIMQRALADETAFALAVGADSPGTPPDRFELARSRLGSGEVDAVIGLSLDGGFYLLGLSRCPDGLFDDLPWSQAHTGQAMMQRLRDRGLSVEVLDPWFDVDEAEDLNRLKLMIDQGRITAPATARALETHDRGRAPRVSVIVPTLNESARIASQLAALAADPGLDEVIIVDGLSGDDTAAEVRRAGGMCAQSQPGRARQMNAGAALATGDVLLFVHADVRLPGDASSRISLALSDAGVVAGAFLTWTVSEGRATRLGPWLHLADIRSRYTRLPYGDQAIFCRREVFESVGGYPDQPLMEDLELSRRLSRVGRIARVRARVLVSGRRFIARPFFYVLAVNIFPLLYRAGISPERLIRVYRNER